MGVAFYWLRVNSRGWSCFWFDGRDTLTFCADRDQVKRVDCEPGVAAGFLGAPSSPGFPTTPETPHLSVCYSYASASLDYRPWSRSSEPRCTERQLLQFADRSMSAIGPACSTTTSSSRTWIDRATSFALHSSYVYALRAEPYPSHRCFRLSLKTAACKCKSSFSRTAVPTSRWSALNRRRRRVGLLSGSTLRY
jgi:hypothetical protein